MQHTIDAQAHAAGFAARLDMDITGALLKGVLEQPVDNVDHVGIVGVRLLTHAAQVEQLLEVADTTALLIGGVGTGHRAGQTVELYRIALQVFRIGNHAADIAFEHMLQIGFPAMYKRLGAGDGHLAIIDLDRQNPVALGKGEGHQRRQRRDIDLQRVDTEKRLAALAREPAAEGIEIQLLARPSLILDILRGNELQRVQLGSVAHGGAAQADQVISAVLAQPPLGNQCVQKIAQVQWSITARDRQVGQCLHRSLPLLR